MRGEFSADDLGHRIGYSGNGAPPVHGEQRAAAPSSVPAAGLFTLNSAAGAVERSNCPRESMVRLNGATAATRDHSATARDAPRRPSAAGRAEPARGQPSIVAARNMER
jgi:hypothetical protein